MIVGSFVSFRCARYLVKDDRIYPFAIAVVVGGLVAARIAHVSDNWNVYAGRPFELVAFWNGGIATTGAPIGSSIAGYVMARRLRLPLGFMFDVSVIELGDLGCAEHERGTRVATRRVNGHGSAGRVVHDEVRARLAVQWVFRNEEKTRSEFLSLIRQRPNGV